jgi:hypothetical protein
MAKVVMTLTVDWEGWFLDPRDLKAMRALYAQLEVLQNSLGEPIPITHFICARYFTETDVQSSIEANREKVLSALGRKQDEIGAHVHSWESLFLASGIPKPDIKVLPVGQNFDPPTYSRKGKSDFDIGYQVPFGAYSQAEITKVLQATMVLLQKYLSLPAAPVSFRCGCWVTCNSIFKALQAAGLQNDASAVPFNYITNVIMKSDPSDLTRWLVAIWGDKQVTSGEPWLRNSLSFAQYPNGILGMGDTQISEPAIVDGIVEVPDTAMLLPWANQALMNSHIDQAFKIAETSGQDVYISLGFHQETCGTASSFEVSGFPLTAEEKKVQLNGILGAVAHAVSKSLRMKVPVEFIKKTSLAERTRLRAGLAAAGTTTTTADAANKM